MEGFDKTYVKFISHDLMNKMHKQILLYPSHLRLPSFSNDLLLYVSKYVINDRTYKERNLNTFPRVLLI